MKKIEPPRYNEEPWNIGDNVYNAKIEKYTIGVNTIYGNNVRTQTDVIGKSSLEPV